MGLYVRDRPPGSGRFRVRGDGFGCLLVCKAGSFFLGWCLGSTFLCFVWDTFVSPPTGNPFSLMQGKPNPDSSSSCQGKANKYEVRCYHQATIKGDRRLESTSQKLQGEVAHISGERWGSIRSTPLSARDICIARKKGNQRTPDGALPKRRSFTKTRLPIQVNTCCLCRALPLRSPETRVFMALSFPRTWIFVQRGPLRRPEGCHLVLPSTENTLSLSVICSSC